MNIFDQQHIFIIFNPGSAGNFLAGVISGILNSELSVPFISSAGSSHTIIRGKTEGTDYLSFGTLVEEHQQFASQEDRENFYIENIKKKYPENQEHKPEVVWTHDFTNIPLYRKYFKNSHILVITNQTDEEKLIAIFMHSLKTFLDKDAILPVTGEIRNAGIERWVKHCGRELIEFLPRDQVSKILWDARNEEYKDILSYGTFRMLLKFYGMLSMVEDAPTNYCIFDHIFYFTNDLKDQKVPFKLGPKTNVFVDENCVILPFIYLANNDSDLLTSKLSDVLKRNLTSEEKNYIKKSFEKYRSSQNQLLLSDPRQYYNIVKNRVLDIK